MPTPEEVFDYIDRACTPAYDEHPELQHGYGTDEEKQHYYTTLAEYAVAANEGDHFLDGLDAATFEAAYDMLENENFHGEGTALCYAMYRAGLQHTYINQEAQLAPYLFD